MTMINPFLPTAPPEVELFTIEEWADTNHNGLKLSSSYKITLSNLVTDFYRKSNIEPPPKVHRRNGKGYKLSAVRGYPRDHFHIINLCFLQMIAKA